MKVSATGSLMLAAALLSGGRATLGSVVVPELNPELGPLLTLVGQRVTSYYERADSVMFVERSTVQPIARNWSPEGLSRSVEADVRVELRGDHGERLAEPRVTRHIRQINGRE